MRVFTVAPSADPITTFEGLRLLPDFTFASAPPADVLVVPSAEHSMDTDLANEALIDWIRIAGRRAQYVLSLCDGAFVLAQAGLLDGRDATTFPADVERLRAAFPAVRVHEDLSFVHDGPAITSAGGALSYDAALYLTELLYGASAARGIARGLCIDWDLGGVEHEVRNRE
jgi:transcriptional regulator GlxA family with amidase domain